MILNAINKIKFKKEFLEYKKILDNEIAIYLDKYKRNEISEEELLRTIREVLFRVHGQLLKNARIPAECSRCFKYVFPLTPDRLISDWDFYVCRSGKKIKIKLMCKTCAEEVRKNGDYF